MGGVSVVIRTYQRSKYLEGAIETALRQTHEPAEVIVVDDGSTTNYATEIAAEYDRVRCIRHDENRGASAAMNTGIEDANGEFVAFLDDDDRWRETKLERQVEALTERPEAGLATCLRITVRPDGEPLTCQSSAPAGDLSNRILIDNAVGSPSRVLVRNAVVERYRFDEGLPTKNDWDFYLRVCQEWPVALVPERLYIRTHHPSLSTEPSTAARDLLAVARKHEEEIRARGLWSRTMAAYHTGVGRKFIVARNRRKARRHLRRAVGLHSTGRRLALLAFTFLPWRVFTMSLLAKRTKETYRHDDARMNRLSQSVPGFPPSGATTS